MSVPQAEAGPVARVENSRAVRDTVELHIKELISAGHLGEGRLPTERELAEQLGVSRTTVRQVLDRLEHDGLVYRRRGRTGGTFVNRPRVDIDFGYLAGIPAYLRAQGFRPGAHVVSARMVPADDTTARALRIPAGTLAYDAAGQPVEYSNDLFRGTGPGSSPGRTAARSTATRSTARLRPAGSSANASGPEASSRWDWTRANGKTPDSRT
jgi:DNA-binding transcriptional ArsR family regulator